LLLGPHEELLEIGLAPHFLLEVERAFYDWVFEVASGFENDPTNCVVPVFEFIHRSFREGGHRFLLFLHLRGCFRVPLLPVEVLLSLLDQRVLELVCHHDEPEVVEVGQLPQVVSFLPGPLPVDGSDVLVVLLFGVLNDVQFFVELSEIVGLIDFLLLGPVTELLPIVPAMVGELVPNPLVSLLLQVLLIFYEGGGLLRGLDLGDAAN
jgi:hypothetical protein